MPGDVSLYMEHETVRPHAHSSAIPAAALLASVKNNMFQNNNNKNDRVGAALHGPAACMALVCVVKQGPLQLAMGATCRFNVITLNSRTFAENRVETFHAGRAVAGLRQG